jgi:hypothetical protein
MSRSSGLGPESAVTITGSSAIPQIGHDPGPGWRISGCIGQVHSEASPCELDDELVLGRGALWCSACAAEAGAAAAVDSGLFELVPRYRAGSASKADWHRAEQNQ